MITWRPTSHSISKSALAPRRFTTQTTSRSLRTPPTRREPKSVPCKSRSRSPASERASNRRAVCDQRAKLRVEADKGTESVTTVIRQKILAYREIVASGIIDDYLGVDNLKVLFATTSAKRMRHMMRELETIARNGKSTMFGFRAEDGFDDFLKAPKPNGNLYRERWARVGHPDFSLSEAENHSRK